MDRAMAVHQIGEQLSGVTIGGLFSGLMALLNLLLLFYYSAVLALLAIVVAILTAIVTAVSATSLEAVSSAYVGHTSGPAVASGPMRTTTPPAMTICARWIIGFSPGRSRAGARPRRPSPIAHGTAVGGGIDTGKNRGGATSTVPT